MRQIHLDAPYTLNLVSKRRARRKPGSFISTKRVYTEVQT